MTASLHTLHPSRPIDDFTRKHILSMWACKRMDTKQIAGLAGVTEAQVYNVLHAHREAHRNRAQVTPVSLTESATHDSTKGGNENG